MSRATAPTAAVPVKSRQTKAIPEPSCSQRGISEGAPGIASMSVRVALMCHRKAMPAKGTMWRPTVTSTLPRPTL